MGIFSTVKLSGLNNVHMAQLLARGSVHDPVGGEPWQTRTSPVFNDLLALRACASLCTELVVNVESVVLVKVSGKVGADAL